jgi:hypothetical protein
MVGSLLLFFLLSIRLIKPKLTQVTDSLSIGSFQTLLSAVVRIEDVCALATIRAYFADFAASIDFCDLKNQYALPLIQRLLRIIFVVLLASADYLLVFGG